MAIPKTLHVIWLGSPIPQKFMGNIADWQLLNPGWSLDVWTEPLHDMYNLDLYWDAGLYVKPDAVWQMRADLLRYEILQRHGGFYVDVDTKPLRPIGDLFDGLTEFAVAEDEHFTGNTYLAANPGHWAISALVRRAAERASYYQNAAAGLVTGPQYLTPIWQEHGCHVDQRTELWFPYSWSHVRKYQEKKVEIPEDAYAIHQWEHSLAKRKHSDRAARQK